MRFYEMRVKVSVKYGRDGDNGGQAVRDDSKAGVPVVNAGFW